MTIQGGRLSSSSAWAAPDQNAACWIPMARDWGHPDRGRASPLGGIKGLSLPSSGPLAQLLRETPDPFREPTLQPPSRPEALLYSGLSQCGPTAKASRTVASTLDDAHRAKCLFASVFPSLPMVGRLVGVRPGAHSGTASVHVSCCRGPSCSPIRLSEFEPPLDAGSAASTARCPSRCDRLSAHSHDSRCSGRRLCARIP